MKVETPFVNFTLSKFKGLNNQLPLHDMAGYALPSVESYLQAAQNVDITDANHLRRRAPATRVVSANIHSLWSDEATVCLYRQGADLKRLNTDYSSTTLATGFVTQTVPMNFLKLVNKVYYADGLANGVIENGENRTWGITPPVMPRITLTSGTLPAGEYKATVTYAMANGQESGAPYPLIIGLPSDNLSINMYLQASPNPAVKYINIYFSSSANLFFHQDVSNIDAIINIDSKKIKGRTCKTLGLVPMPVGSLLEYYNGRIFVAQGNVIWFSEPFAYELCDLSNNYVMLEDDVTGIGAVDDGLWLTTSHKSYFASNPNPPYKFIERSEDGAIKGTMKHVPAEHFGGKPNDLYVMWTSPKGITLGQLGGALQNLTESVFTFPHAAYGTSLFRRSRGINQFITALKSAESAENTYQTNGGNIRLPLIQIGGN
jgi:hypothetical protein